MDGEPRLATRAPDGQVLREWDRYPPDAARALEADMKHWVVELLRERMQ